MFEKFKGKNKGQVPGGVGGLIALLVLIALGAFAGVLFLLDIENVEDEPA